MASISDMLVSQGLQSSAPQPLDITGSLTKGASLAMEAEKIQQNKMQLQAKLAELQQTKVQKLYDFVQGAHNYSNAADRNAYLKNAYGFAAAMNLDQSILPKGALDGMGSDENMGRMVTLNNMIESGELKPAEYLQILRDKEAFAKVNPTPAEAIDLGKVSAQPAIKDVMDRANQLAVAKTRAAGNANNYDATVKDFSKQVNQNFSKIETEKTALSSALDARDRIANSLAKDPSGRSASPVDMGAMIYSLLHSELGRVNHTELDNQLKLPGLEQMTQDQIVKALGGVNPTTFKFLADRLETAARNVDKAAETKSTSLEAQLNAHKNLSEEQRTALRGIKAPYTTPVYRPRPGMVSFNGRNWSRDELQKLIDAHPDDPKAEAARAALKGG